MVGEMYDLLRQAVQPIKRRGLIAFRQRRIIEDRILEVRDFPLEQKNRLPDVQQLRGIFPKNVYAQQLQRLSMKEQL